MTKEESKGRYLYLLWFVHNAETPLGACGKWASGTLTSRNIISISLPVCHRHRPWWSLSRVVSSIALPVTMESKKRKRNDTEDDAPVLTFHAPGGRTFDRLLKGALKASNIWYWSAYFYLNRYIIGNSESWGYKKAQTIRENRRTLSAAPRWKKGRSRRRYVLTYRYLPTSYLNINIEDDFDALRAKSRSATSISIVVDVGNNDSGDTSGSSEQGSSANSSVSAGSYYPSVIIITFSKSNRRRRNRKLSLILVKQINKLRLRYLQ